MSKKPSAGLLMYRLKNGRPEVLLVHPGGPFWAKKDFGSWSIPKGQADNGETGDELLEVAKREFEEETSIKPAGEFIFLVDVPRSSGGRVYAWAFDGPVADNFDPKDIKSNLIKIEWPPKSGKMIEIPECDRGDFFSLDDARKKVVPYQVVIIDAFEKLINKI